MFLNSQPAKKPLLTRKDQEELNFPDERTFLCHVEAAPRMIYDSIMRLQKHLVLLDKQSCKLKKKLTNYEKANKAYVIENKQLKSENKSLKTQSANLENQLADLKKQLKIAHLHKCPTPLFLPPPASAFDDSNGKSKHFHYSHHSRKTKSTKLSDLPMLTDGNIIRFDINRWESKMAKKLAANADHYNIEALCMVYMDSHMDGDAYGYLTARSRISARKLFATAEKMFEVLQKTYSDVNWQHTAMNKFRDLKMTKNFNSFWAEFQVLASGLDYNKATLISELKYKLTSSLSQVIAGDISWPKDIHKYVKQYQEVYQNLKNIESQTPATNFAGNRYNWGETNTNANTSINTGINANAKTANCSERPANFSYNRLFSVASNLAIAMRPACSKVTRLSKEKIAKLHWENWCFYCKEVRDYWPQYSKKWWPMTVITNSTALILVNISEVAVLQPGHVETENT